VYDIKASCSKFEVGVAFFAVTIKGMAATNGKEFAYGATLSANTSSLMKGKVDTAVKSACAKSLDEMLLNAEKFLLDTGANLGIPPGGKSFSFQPTVNVKFSGKDAVPSGKEMPADPPGTASGNMAIPKSGPYSKAAAEAAKANAEAEMQGMPFKVTPEAKVKPVVMPDGVVALKDAVALGQKVKGTDSTSVYRCMAINPVVKLAARVQSIADGHSISIRAEGNYNPQVRKAMVAAGMTASTAGHYSIHFQSQGVPCARVIGAFLMGLGIEFEDQIKTLKEIGVTE
jgi:hypothetical protein